MKLVRLIYSPKTRIRPHVTPADSRVCEDDIKDRYGFSPAERRPTEEYWLDPGGFALADTEAIRFDVQGISFAIKSEHLWAIDSFSTRTFTDWKTTSSWTKVYSQYDILVIPTAVWGEVIGLVNAFASVLPDGRQELSDRMKDMPDHLRPVRLKKK